MSATSVLARKWRPRSFAELCGQEHVVQALTNALTQNRLHHAYLFTGTRGVGKTTIARILAKSLNCETGITAAPCGICNACTEIDGGRFVDLIELDAASNTQVSNMRELLESALYAPTSGRFKVYIIDEAHMLSKSAFNAMLKTLEEPPAHVKFILATTDPQKIPVTVLSRCLQFNLKQMPPQLIVSHLQHVLDKEGVPFESAALNLLARAAAGSMRDALSLLDQAIAYASGKVDESLVRAMLGAIDQGYLFDILETLKAGNGAGLLKIADAMALLSLSFEAALQDLATLLHRIALVQTIPGAIPEDEPERARLMELAQRCTPEEIQLYYQIAIHGRHEIDLAPDEYAGFTMTLLRMLAFAPQVAGGQAMPVASHPVSAHAHTSQLTGSLPGGSAGASASAVSTKLDWNMLLSQLNLQGMARELARNSVLVDFSGEKMVLGLAAQYKHLQSNKIAQDKLQSALSEYFAKPVKLVVEVGLSQDGATPATLAQQEQKIRQQQAEEAIRQDAFVQEAQSLLGAQLIEGSIRSV